MLITSLTLVLVFSSSDYALTVGAIVSVMVLKASEAVSDNTQIALFKEGRIHAGATTQALRSLIFIACLYVSSRLGFAASLAFVVAATISVYAVYLSSPDELKLSRSMKNVLVAMRRAASVAMAVFLITVMTSAPRVITGSIGASEDFLAISMVFPLVFGVTVVVGSVVSVNLAGVSKKSRAQRVDNSQQLIHRGLGAGLVAAALLVPSAYLLGGATVRTIYGIDVEANGLFAATSLGAAIAVTQSIFNGALVSLSLTDFLMRSVLGSAVVATGVLGLLLLVQINVGMSATLCWCVFGITHCLLCARRIKAITT
ncbi:hypothetical protein [Arenimonas alkanexedens]